MTPWASERHPPIPGYEPIRVLGQNGAIVYVAHSARFDKPIALQVWSNRTLPANVAAMVGLEHPNILGVLDVGEVAGHVYVALEYLEGVESLGARLGRGPRPEADARGLASVIVSVLQFLRERGVTVGTPTPGDVLLGETPKLMLHSTSGHYGRPDFMAPEKLSHTQATAAAIDVYRVGALLYAMLTGRFAGFTGFSTSNRLAVSACACARAADQPRNQHAARKGMHEMSCREATRSIRLSGGID